MGAKRRRERSFTDVGLDPNQIPDDHEPSEPTITEVARGEVRYHFSLLLGESTPLWTGSGLWIEVEGGEFICGGCWRYAKLPVYAYCLNCDRCGQDHRIATPTERELAALGRRVYEPDPDLAGGIGRSLAAKARAG